MRDKLIQYLKNYFSRYALYTELIAYIGFIIGLVLFYFILPLAVPVLAFFTFITALFFILRYTILPRSDESISVPEKLINTLSGFAMMMIVLGITIKITAWSENDKFLNMGIGMAVVIIAAYFLSILLKSLAIKKENIPLSRIIIICFIGLIFFVIPIEIKQSYNSKKPVDIHQLVPQQEIEVVIGDSDKDSMSNEPTPVKEEAIEMLEPEEIESDSTQ